MLTVFTHLNYGLIPCLENLACLQFLITARWLHGSRVWLCLRWGCLEDTNTTRLKSVDLEVTFLKLNSPDI